MAISCSESLSFQLNDGEQLYASHLPGIFRVHGVGELLRFRERGVRGLAPDQIGVRRVRDGARDRGVDAALRVEEALVRALARDERPVGRIDVARDQRRGIGIRASDDQRRHTHQVGRESRRHEVADRRLRRDQHLTAEVAALLLRRELVFEVHARGAGLDEALHDLVAIQRSAEARLRHRRRSASNN